MSRILNKVSTFLDKYQNPVINPAPDPFIHIEDERNRTNVRNFLEKFVDVSYNTIKEFRICYAGRGAIYDLQKIDY